MAFSQLSVVTKNIEKNSFVLLFLYRWKINGNEVYWLLEKIILGKRRKPFSLVFFNCCEQRTSKLISEWQASHDVLENFCIDIFNIQNEEKMISWCS